MEIKTDSKKVSVFQVVIYIALVALMAVVIFQNHRINLLTRDNSGASQDKNVTAEKQMETLDMVTQIGEIQSGKISAETLQKESEYVNDLYDTKISEILNPKELEAYREYSKYESEQRFLSEFKRSMEYTGGTSINREQEKELVSAMYIESQKFTEMLKDLQQSVNPNAPVLSKENLEKSVNLQKDLFKGYLAASKDILTDSQQAQFNTYIDSQNSMLEMSVQLLGGAGNQTKKSQ